MQQTNAVNRSSALALFKRCIRSTEKIPDANQRASYRIYVRDAFHRCANLPSDSREALVAYRDGLDQVEQMEYYHEQMKIKNSERQMIKPAVSLQLMRSKSTKLDNSSPGNDANDIIARWLLQYLPHLNHDDVAKYSKHLVDDGFDSVAFIEKELVADDVKFMKKAHRRVIERQLRDWNQRKRNGGNE
jgi:hypothetical protein